MKFGWVSSDLDALRGRFGEVSEEAKIARKEKEAAVEQFSRTTEVFGFGLLFRNCGG